MVTFPAAEYHRLQIILCGDTAYTNELHKFIKMPLNFLLTFSGVYCGSTYQLIQRQKSNPVTIFSYFFPISQTTAQQKQKVHKVLYERYFICIILLLKTKCVMSTMKNLITA